ncbi:MAG TPA: tetratricopeptide repeat protein [Candidatus Hydrogenedentes bacterium]|nr:tetratricopeptide repeat protein [Candidatus Hydrogenedentota bacterium]
MKNNYRHGVALAALVVLAAALRLYGIERESVWFDEFTSLVFLNAPDAYTQSPFYERWQQQVFHRPAQSWFEFLKTNHEIDPATMPVYDTIEYFWNRLVSRSPSSQRMLSVFFGLLIVPLIYVFGRALHSPAAGLVAALLVTLSPIHRHFAQEIHMYVHLTLFALASAYTFFRLLRDGGKRWWISHLAVNVLIVWTHTFGAMVPAIEGLFFLLFHARKFKPLCLWMACHVLIAIPFLLFLTTIKFWSAEETSEWQKVPTRQEFIGDLFADDFIGMTYQLRGTPTAFEWILQPPYARALAEYKWKVGRAAMWLFIVAILGLGIKCLLDWIHARKRGGEPPEWKWYCFLAMFWLLPPLVLYTASVYWRPVIFPRYTTYCSLGAYLLIGMAIASIRRRPIRAGAVGALVVLYVYQIFLVIGDPQRTSWLAAGNHIRAGVKADDLLLVQDWMWKRVFAYNLGPIGNVLSYAKTPEVLAEQAAFYLALDRPPKTPGDGPPSVWIAYETYYFSQGPWTDLDRELTARGLSFTMTEFPGIQHVLIYKVDGKPAPRSGTPKLPEQAPVEFGDLAMEFWRVRDYETAIAAARKAIEIQPDYSRAYSYMGMAYKDMGDADNALAAFSKAVELNATDYLWSHVNIGTLLTEKGDYEGAAAAIGRALAMDPKYGWAYTCLGKVYMGKRDYEKAIMAFQKAIEYDPGDARPRDALRDAMALMDAPPPEPPPSDEQQTVANTASIPAEPAPDIGETPPRPESSGDAKAALKRGEEQLQANDLNGALASFREAIGPPPGDPNAYLNIGVVLLAKNDDMGAKVSFRKAFELKPELKEVIGPFVAALIERKDYDAAWAELKRLRAMYGPLPAPLVDRLRRDSGRNE